MPSRTPTRRALLLGGTGILTLAAGCISDLESELEPGSGSDDTDAEADDEDGAENTTGTDDADADEDDDEDGDTFDYERHQYQYPETPTEPNVSLLLDTAEANDWLTARGFDEDSLAAVVDDVDFEDAVLVALEADAPNHCYEMVLEEISFAADDDEGDDDGTAGDDTDETTETDSATRGTLTLEAAVRDVADDDELCAQARTTVGVLVRVSGTVAPISEVSALIVDHDGNEHGISIGVASNSDSDSDSGSDSDSDSTEDDTTDGESDGSDGGDDSTDSDSD